MYKTRTQLRWQRLLTAQRRCLRVVMLQVHALQPTCCCNRPEHKAAHLEVGQVQQLIWQLHAAHHLTAERQACQPNQAGHAPRQHAHAQAHQLQRLQLRQVHCTHQDSTADP